MDQTSKAEAVAAQVDRVVIRDGFPPLNVGDVIVVSFGHGMGTFVVIPQSSGTGLAVKMLLGSHLSPDPWMLDRRHFKDGWSVIGRYELPVEVPVPVPVKRKSWWNIFGG